MESQKYRLNRQDLENWGKNLLIFFIPSILLGITALQAGADWEYTFGVFSAGVLNALSDLLRKFLAENK